ncbi:MAG TPA: hypothetical protein VH253_08955 [Phycisphaerae bacterium]|nr:hypothetical protein [Phycisphaerae bacterium]
MLIYGVLMLLTIALAGTGTSSMQRGFDGWELLGVAPLVVGSFHVARYVRGWWIFVLMGAGAAWLEGTLFAGPGLGELSLGGGITELQAKWLLGAIVAGVVLATLAAGELGAWNWREEENG